jgi:hypothetical protein
MSDPGERSPGGSPDEPESEDSLAMVELVKRSLGAPHSAKDSPDLLVGVQRKLRQRSRGKFYGDGWSTAHTRTSYVLVSIVMLIIMGIAYLALGPMGVVPR